MSAERRAPCIREEMIDGIDKEKSDREPVAAAERLPGRGRRTAEAIWDLIVKTNRLIPAGARLVDGPRPLTDAELASCCQFDVRHTKVVLAVAEHLCPGFKGPGLIAHWCRTCNQCIASRQEVVEAIHSLARLFHVPINMRVLEFVTRNALSPANVAAHDAETFQVVEYELPDRAARQFMLNCLDPDGRNSVGTSV